MTDNPPSYPCPKCGNAVLYTHGAIGRPVWCFCRACGTMFNPEHTGIQPVETPAPVVTVPAELVDEAAADALDAVIHEQLAQLTDPEPVPPAPNPEPDAPAPAERKRTMAPRPDPSTPFNDEELAKLPNWAQGKVRYLNAQLVRVLEQLASAPAPEPVTGEARPAEGGTPPLGLTVSEDGDLLNWEGENYVRQSELVAVRYTAGARLARLAELVSEGLEELPELEGYDDADE